MAIQRVAECLLSMYKALGSILSITYNNNCNNNNKNMGASENLIAAKMFLVNITLIDTSWRRRAG